MKWFIRGMGGLLATMISIAVLSGVLFFGWLVWMCMWNIWYWATEHEAWWIIYIIIGSLGVGFFLGAAVPSLLFVIGAVTGMIPSSDKQSEENQ